MLVLKVPFEKAAPPLALRIGGGSGGGGGLGLHFFLGGPWEGPSLRVYFCNIASA